MGINQRVTRLERIVKEVCFDVPIQNATGSIPRPLMAKAVHIRNEVCDHFGVTLTQLLSKMRPNRVCRARFATTLLLNEHAQPITLHELAGMVGKIDHGTAMHQLSRAKYMMEPGVDLNFAATVAAIRSKLKNPVDTIGVK